MAGLLALVFSLSLIATTAGFAEDTNKPRKPQSLFFVPTVKWLPEPFPVRDSVAATEKEMKPYREIISGTKVTFDVVPIPGGTFTMGSPADEPKRKSDEGPQHRVRIDPFWMGKCEVTWDEYDLWINFVDHFSRKRAKREPTQWDDLADALTCASTCSSSDPTMGMGREGCPAVNVTQYAAKLYCKWLSAKTGRYYRLPTEAEWEYACRAGTTTAYSFGDDPKALDEYAVYWDNCDDGYHRVGSKRPNPWGLYDMHGNVSEWVLDQYIPGRYQQLAKTTADNPVAVPRTIYPRVVRGGSWDDDPETLRSAARTRSSPKWKQSDPQIPQSIVWHTDAYFVGFRVVRPLRVPTVKQSRRYEPTPSERSLFDQYRTGPGKESLEKESPEKES
ncbi:MAG: formylglycine-generating enzyme family protein [Planctomycetes bacterium]|nr:formylglycine-generating enzyme family protein [Planctomycetota bacterium]